MAEAPVLAFFNAAHDLLQACFSASTMLSNASKGSSRETAARELLRALVPPVARIESGDIIDSLGNQTGQLDAVVVDHRAPTLKLAGAEPALVFAEGALAVLEVKSNLRKQWKEVLKTYARVAPIRPWVPVRNYTVESVRKVIEERADEHRAIPFIVVAGTGWTREKPLVEFLEGMKGVLPTRRARAWRPAVLVVTLAPPFIGEVSAAGQVGVHRCDTEHRGATVALVWHCVVNQARMHSSGQGSVMRRLPLMKYFAGVPRAGKSAAGAPAMQSQSKPAPAPRS